MRIFVQKLSIQGEKGAQTQISHSTAFLVLEQRYYDQEQISSIVLIRKFEKLNKVAYINIMICRKMCSKWLKRVIGSNSKPAINKMQKIRMPFGLFLNEQTMERIEVAIVNNELKNERIERFRAYPINKHKSTNRSKLSHGYKSVFGYNTT